MVFMLKILVVEKKGPVFLTNLFLSQQMKQKKLFLVIFGFLGEKLSLDYVINTKSQILPVKIFFFRKIYFLAQKQVCNQKSDKKFFTSNFCFSF